MAQIGFDRRRINGPEESSTPVFEEEVEQNAWKLGDARVRRNPAEIRPIFLQPGLINQANGSAYIETERTKIACAVYGPRQSKNTAFSEKGRLNVEVKFTPFSCERRRTPMHDAEDRSIAMAIHQALVASVRLELLPKSTIDVFIIVMEADGMEGCVASGSVAASSALADAGIEIFGLVASCSASIVGKEVWLDPSEKEAQASEGTVVVSCMPALGTVTSIWQSGKLSSEEVLMCLDECQTRCMDIHSVVAQTLRESV